MVKGVKVQNLIEDIKEQLELHDNYLIVEVAGVLMVFIHKDILDITNQTVAPEIMNEQLHDNWGVWSSEKINIGYSQLWFGFDTFWRWRYRIGRATEWDKRGIRDEIEKHIMYLNREEPVIYLGD